MADLGNDPIPWLTPLEQLPNEILFKILLSLNPESLQNQCRTSKKFKAVCTDDYFWRLRFKQDYPEYFDIKDMTGQYKQTWTTFYQITQSYMEKYNKISVYNMLLYAI